MAISRGLIIFLVAFAISCTLATPIKRLKVKSSKQIEFTTSSSVVDEHTGYPEAGFRPKIPFDLPNEKLEPVTKSFEIRTTTPAESVSVDFDEVLPTTVKTDIEDHTPADTYGAPFHPTDDAVEIEAEVVSAPSENFQPPNEDSSPDFAAAFDVIDNNDGDVIADLPAIEQASETKDLDRNNQELPADLYGVPETELDEPKTDIETFDAETEHDEDEEKTENKVNQPELVDVEDIQEEDSTESELGSGVHEPADTYGAPKSEFDEENEIESELAEVEQQLEILSRLTRMKTGRLVILPIENNLYLGRLVARQTKRDQRKNGRLLNI